MRWRRPVRTLTVYALAGALATVLTSWAIHAAQFARLRAACTANGATHEESLWASTPRIVPSLAWHAHAHRARERGIDPAPPPGRVGIDASREPWLGRFGVFIGDDPGDAKPARGVDADAAWRRHRRTAPGMAPTPALPFHSFLFHPRDPAFGWLTLRSEAHLVDGPAGVPGDWVPETLIVVRTGWPAPALEAGAHYAQGGVQHAPANLAMGGFAGVYQLTGPPRASRRAGLTLWTTPAPTAGRRPHAYGVLDRFALPLLPLWPGFLLNTCLYAILTFTLVRTPRVLRRALRRRGGRCVGCGYDRAGLDSVAACPECGREMAMGIGQ